MSYLTARELKLFVIIQSISVFIASLLLLINDHNHTLKELIPIPDFLDIAWGLTLFIVFAIGIYICLSSKTQVRFVGALTIIYGVIAMIFTMIFLMTAI